MELNFYRSDEPSMVANYYYRPEELISFHDLLYRWPMCSYYTISFFTILRRKGEEIGFYLHLYKAESIAFRKSPDIKKTDAETLIIKVTWLPPFYFRIHYEVNQTLLKEGLAWVHPQFIEYADKQGWRDMESISRTANIGLWGHPNQVSPWEWQIQNTAPTETILENVAVYRGNINTGVFHRESCRFYNCEGCVASTINRDAAIQYGFIPCKICNP